jgi:hypothetical protein
MVQACGFNLHSVENLQSRLPGPFGLLMPQRGRGSSQNAELVRACPTNMPSFAARLHGARVSWRAWIRTVGSSGRRLRGRFSRAGDRYGVRNLHRTSGDSGGKADPACGKSFRL